MPDASGTPVRSQTATAAPSARSLCATAQPMPDAPPVTTALRPANRVSPAMVSPCPRTFARCARSPRSAAFSQGANAGSGRGRASRRPMAAGRSRCAARAPVGAVAVLRPPRGFLVGVGDRDQLDGRRPRRARLQDGVAGMRRARFRHEGGWLRHGVGGEPDAARVDDQRSARELHRVGPVAVPAEHDLRVDRSEAGGDRIRAAAHDPAVADLVDQRIVVLAGRSVAGKDPRRDDRGSAAARRARPAAPASSRS